MDFITNITITSSKLNSLIEATDTFKNYGKFFLKGDPDKGFVIVDVVNFGFLSFFPFLSNLLNISVINLVSYFFLALFLLSFVITSITLFAICENKLKIYPFFIIICFIYLVTYEFILTSSAEYFIYFFWGILPFSYYYFLKKKFNIQLSFIITFSLLLILLGSFLYYSFIGFLLFYLININIENKQTNRILFNVIPIIAFLTLISSQHYSNNQAVKNLLSLQKTTFETQNYPADLGNNAYFTFYAGLGFITSDYFEGNFHDDEIYKAVGKLNKDGGRLNDKKLGTLTQLTINDLEKVKKKIYYLFFNEPFFIFKVIFAKVGVLLGYFLVITNIFLFYFFSKNISNYYKIPLLINLLISAIIPIISIPSKLYSLGFLGASLSILFISYCKNRKFIKVN